MSTALELPEQIAVHDRDHGTVHMPGVTVAPGLAITQYRNNRGTVAGRYSLTHIPSGFAIPLGTGRCAEHIQQVLQAVADSGIDWTADKGAVVAEAVAKGLGGTLLATVGRNTCQRRYGCPGDPPAPKPWLIRCDTCDWEYEWDEDYDDPPLDAKAAKDIARDHECEPRLLIAPPGGAKWYSPSLLNDDGSVRDLTGGLAVAR